MTLLHYLSVTKSRDIKICIKNTILILLWNNQTKSITDKGIAEWNKLLSEIKVKIIKNNHYILIADDTLLSSAIKFCDCANGYEKDDELIVDNHRVTYKEYAINYNITQIIDGKIKVVSENMDINEAKALYKEIAYNSKLSIDTALNLNIKNKGNITIINCHQGVFRYYAPQIFSEGGYFLILNQQLNDYCKDLNELKEE